VSVAGLVCLNPGRRGHLFYRLRIDLGRKGERRSMSEDDYAALITAAHHQLHNPIVLCWDNLNTHVSAAMRDLLARHHRWLTVVQLPAYASDLNPTEGVWSLLKRSLGNIAVRNVDDLATLVRNWLKRIQYRPELLTGCLTQTGLAPPGSLRSRVVAGMVTPAGAPKPSR
jgi:putative transposase